MNSETKLALIAFIDAVQTFIESGAAIGTQAEVTDKAEQLKKQLNSDETIV